MTEYKWNIMDRFVDSLVKDSTNLKEDWGCEDDENQSFFDGERIAEWLYGWALKGGVAKEDFYDFAVWFDKQIHLGYKYDGGMSDLAGIFGYILQDRGYVYGYDEFDGGVLLIWTEEE